MWFLAVVALLLVCVTPAAAQTPGTYDAQRAAVGYNCCGSTIELSHSPFVLDVTQTTGDPEGWWEFRDRATGQVICIANPDGSYVDCEGGWSGSMWWTGQDTLGRDAFEIQAEGISTHSGRYMMVGNLRTAPAASVTITAPTQTQVVSGTTPVRVTTSGFTGTRTWVLLVDGVQRQSNTTTSDSFVIWFNTTRVANGTHSFTVRVTESSSSAEASVSVTVRN